MPLKQAQGIEVYLYNGQTAKHLAKAYFKEKKTDCLDADILANLLNVAEIRQPNLVEQGKQATMPRVFSHTRFITG